MLFSLRQSIWQYIMRTSVHPCVTAIHTTTFRGICCVVLLLIACNSRNQPITSQDKENRMQLVGQIKCGMMVFTNFLFDLELNRISLSSKANEIVYGII